MPDSSQVTIAELKTMRPEEINKARKEGRLADVLAGREPEPVDDEGLEDPAGGADLGARPGPPVPRQLKEHELAGMTPDELVKAYREGACDVLLGRRL